MKKLYRSDKNRIVAGILGGLGEHFGVDPVILRVAFIILVIITGVLPGVFIYLIALFIIPKK
ncbi:MAG TPA: PspC domain-containing protein [Candidatus Yonathbacteria bacterium]|nr:PspC domain-containing protein [Candidatus Yonathbacteria bacterium]